MAEDLGLTNVTFYESPSTSVIRDLYKNAKTFVCPSRNKEGVLTTLLEAAASGCAVITTSGSGMTDLVTSPSEGMIVSPGDTTALKDAINTLLGNDTNRIKMARTLQTKICQSWTWQAKSVELERIYRGSTIL
jgi:glycosyltransferase involved in cell wall biosynthesis